MAANRTYDLMLVISAAADDERRAKIREDAEAAIAAGGGEVVAKRDWGERPLTFEIDHQGRGTYELIEFAAPAGIVAPLTRQLRITDGVLRARVTHAVPGVDEIPEGPRSITAPAPASESALPGPGAAEAPVEPVEAPIPSPEAEEPEPAA